MKKRISDIPGQNEERELLTPLSGLSLEDVNERLDAMTVDEMKALMRVCNAVFEGLLLATREERREAATLKLWRSGMKEQDIYKALPALNAALDREFGKPAQSIKQDVTVTAQRPAMTRDEVATVIAGWINGNGKVIEG